MLFFYNELGASYNLFLFENRLSYMK
jgi:hypothetical protein